MSYARLDEENRKLEEKNKVYLKTLSMYYASHMAIYSVFFDILNESIGLIEQQIELEASNLPVAAKEYIQAYTNNQLLALFVSIDHHELIRDVTKSSETKKALIHQPDALKAHINTAINLELDLEVSLPSKHDFTLFQRAKKVAVKKECKPELNLLIDLRSNFLDYKNKNKRNLVSKILDCVTNLKNKIHNHLDAATLVEELGACIEEAKNSEKKYYEDLWFFSDYRKKHSSLNPLLNMATTLFNTYQAR